MLDMAFNMKLVLHLVLCQSAVCMQLEHDRPFEGGDYLHTADDHCRGQTAVPDSKEQSLTTRL